MSTYSIYALLDPLTKEVCYVGISKLAARRKEQHISHSRNPKTQKCTSEWISDLLRQGLEPELKILEECDADKEWVAKEIEKQWIDHYVKEGQPLLNRYRTKLGCRFSRILPDREPMWKLDLERGWYYEFI